MLGTSWIIQFVRFNMLGIVHIIAFSLVLFITLHMGVGAFWSGAMAYIVVFLIGAFGNIFYVFRSLMQAGHFWRYFILNALVYCSSVVFELISTHHLIPYIEANYENSSTFIIVLQYVIYGIGGVYVFIMNRYVVFGVKPSSRG